MRKQASCEVGSPKTPSSPTDALAHLGADAPSEALSELKEGLLSGIQDEREVTFAPKVTTRNEAYPEDSAQVNALRVQGFVHCPWPSTC